MTRPHASKGLVALIATLATLAAAEITIRLLLPAPFATIRTTTTTATDTTTGTLVSHPEQGLVYRETTTGRRLQPNLDVTIEHHALSGRPIRLRTNRHGFRGPEIGDKQGFRILFLGDSITFADYLPEEETFVSLVETMARHDGRTWQTINTGVGAIDTRTELAILIEQGMALQPDMVVLCHYLNDFLPSPVVLPTDIPPIIRHSRLASMLWLTTTAKARTRQQAESMQEAEKEFRAALARDYTLKGQPIPPVQSEALKWFGDWGGAWSPKAWALTKPHLEQLADLATRHGFTLRVVSFPAAPQVYHDPIDDAPQRQLKEICSARNIPVLDLLPVLRAARTEARLFYDQCHHTPAGSRVVAEAIYAYLTARD